MVATCAAFGVDAARRDGHPGCWCDPDGAAPRKIGALGIRVERGVTYHGIALNVAPDLADFELIDPCGMPGVASTSVAAELDRARRTADPTADPTADLAAPAPTVATAASVFTRALSAALDAPLIGELPPSADPAAGRSRLERLLTGRAA
jgi:lipoate-protein ligase B